MARRGGASNHCVFQSFCGSELHHLQSAADTRSSEECGMLKGGRVIRRRGGSAHQSNSFSGFFGGSWSTALCHASSAASGTRTSSSRSRRLKTRCLRTDRAAGGAVRTTRTQKSSTTEKQVFKCELEPEPRYWRTADALLKVKKPRCLAFFVL